MKTVMKKLKRSNKVLRYLYYIVGLMYVISLAFFVKSLLSLAGIETLIRIIIIILFIFYLFFYLFYNLLNLLQKKYKGLIITSFITIAFGIIFSFGAYYIDFVYNGLSGMKESKELLYTSYLITLKDADFNNELSIGMINKEINNEDYDLANALYKKEKLSNKIETYDDYIKMLSDLYSGEIGAAFVPGNFVTLFSGEESFEDIVNTTKIIYKHSEKMKNEDLLITSDKKFDEPLTFLLMGVDSEKNGLNANAAFNGDTLMLITLNPSTLNVTMVSIPRDTYVPIACRNNNYSKINSAAAYGTNCVINTVGNFLDIDIDYYVKINFKGVVELVDAVGGIEVDVEKPYFNSNHGVNYHGKVCEQNSNREFGDKIVCMDPGFQKLNGEQALAYSRNRHQYIGSDLDRIKHQQQVVEALASKVLRFSSIKEFQNILNAISNNVATNMETNTILSGYQVVKNILGNVISGDDLINIEKAYLETYSLNVYVPSQGRNTSAQGYYKDSLEDIKKALNITLGKEKEEEIKTFDFSVNKEYKVKVPGKGIRTGSSGATLPDFVGKTVNEAKDFGVKNNIEVKVEYVDEGTHYNPNVGVGLIGSQSVHKNVLLSTVKELTVYVVNSKRSESTNESKTHNNSNSKKATDEEIIKNILG